MGVGFDASRQDHLPGSVDDPAYVALQGPRQGQRGDLLPLDAKVE